MYVNKFTVRATMGKSKSDRVDREIESDKRRVEKI